MTKADLLKVSEMFATKERQFKQRQLLLKMQQAKRQKLK